MKSNTVFYTIIFSWLSISFYSCKEVGPAIDFTPVDTTLLDTTYMEDVSGIQKKALLIEDFTGVRCVNCPSAHEAIQSLITAHPSDTICIAAVHNFGEGAYPESTEDYEYNADHTPKIGFAVDALLGGAIAWPSGIFDRKDYGLPLGIFNIVISNYPIVYDDEIALTPACNIDIHKISFDVITRELLLDIKIKYTSTVTDPNNLSIYITESNLTNPQLTPTGIDYAYTHNYVLRDMLTPVSGVSLSGDKIPGAVFEKEFRYTVNDDWTNANLEIIAFVHNVGSNYNVLQAAKLHGPF